MNFVDVNNDGWEDVFITNGSSPGTENLLYINNGTGSYFEMTFGDIVSDSAPFDGATFGDVNNDGNLDAFVVSWYEQNNYLYFGNGDNTFDRDENAATANVGTFSETAAWGDYDNDGDLDLYITNATDFNGNSLINDFYKNNGNSTFSKILSGVPATHIHASRSVNWVDVDNDCDLDLFISNELNQPDDLYINDGNGNFSASGSAPSQSSRSTMSSSWGDIDNDGDLDLFVSNAGYFSHQNNQLFKNNGNGSFTEITSGQLGTDGSCSYGSNFGDYDNDGDLDIVVSNGFCIGNILNFLYKNDGNGNFTRDLESIEDLSTPCSYGAAWGDMNNDGFLDLGIATCKNGASAPLSKNIFYINLGNENNWIKIKPVGTEANRSAIGAKVWVTATIDGSVVTQMREISSQSGHCGQNSLNAHFGLGDAEMIQTVRVQFSCNSEMVLTDIPANQLIEIEEEIIDNVSDVSDLGIELTVYPNPTAGNFIVNIKKHQADKIQKLSLSDSLGQIVWEKEAFNENQQHLNFELDTNLLNINSGIYYLSVESKNGSLKRPIIVQ